ncbi:MAG: retention module-containing protein, partial [Dechloromonas sp.]|nr:retention module-containing protein [Dechloromonas sp.]
MKNAIAKVSSLSGEVFARTADGTLRRLRTGDSITEGETIVAGQNGRTRLILADGREINIGPRESVAMNAEVAANPPPAAEDSAFFSRPREVRNLARALQEGENLDDLVDEEAPAAGLVGDGSEGHSFVEFLRISETIDSQNSYRIDAGDLGIPDLGAAPADVLDTVPLTLSAELDPASDSGILGDNITNDNTPGIIGTSKPGASITVTMPGTGEVLLTTAATDGSWRVEAGQALADGAQNISVVATDRTGNTLSTTVFVIIDTATPNDGQAPIVTIIEDANDDGFINASELNGDVDVRIAFTGGKVDIGDIIRVSDGSTRIEHVISAADQARGYVETRFAAPGNGETITVTADITDAAGNTSAPGSDSAMIDIDVPNSGQAPEVEITEDANNDGFINRAEASGPADVKVSFNKDKVDVGDTVRVSDGTTSKDFVVSASDKANGFVTTDFPLPSDGSTLTVTAHIFDPAGNRSATGADFAKVDLSTLLNLQLVITEDTNNDGFINASELNGSVGVEITLPTDAIAGDLITIHATGNPTRTITLIQPQIDAGRLSIELDAPANGTNLEVSAQVTDAAGNKSNIATDAAVINTTPPSLTVQLAPASDSGTQGDNLTNDNTPALTGRSDPGTRITVVIPSTGEQLSTITDGNGNWQVTPTLPMPDGTSIVEVTATDSIGNSSNTTLPLTIDTTQFSGQAVAIREDANNDGFINAAELQGDIDVRVTIPNGAAVGDTLTVSATGNASRTITITAAQIATGFVDLAFTPTANNTDFIVNASIADAAGNTSGPVSDYARIQLSPPDAPIVSIVEDANGDGWINAVELQGNIDVRIDLPTGASDGDILLTTVNGVTQPPITLTATDIVNQYIALPGIANPGEGTTLTVTAQIRDTAGNLGSVGSNNARIDTLPPAVTARLDPTSDSGTQGDGITNDNTPTISGTGEAGASITVTLPTGETLKTTVANTGVWSVTPQQPLAEGPATIFVTASDVAGNAANTSVDLTIDTHIPNNKLAPAVTITEDANGDGFINRAEASGPADVRVSFNKDNVDVGDTVRISDGSSVRNIVISAADKANGFVTTDFPLPADGNTLNVSAYLFDAAGNESATGSASAIVDITNYTGLAIEITEDANNDGFINIAELKDNDIDVRITIPQGAAVGDTLTVTAVGNVDKVFTLTAAQIATGFIDTKFNPTSNNTDFKVTAAITDPAGNTAGPVEDSARLQLSAPAEPIVTILEDANNDGWINAAELQGNIDVSVTLPATAVAGNTLISTVNGVTQAPITLTQADIVKGSYALPGIPNPGEGTTLTVTA